MSTGIEKYDKWNYWLNFFIGLDKLGNCVSQGHNSNTISGRTGKHANTPGSYTTYWRLQEAIIDFAFYPIDGPRHCLQAYNKEKDSTTFREGNKLGRALMALIVLPSCIIVGVVFRIAKPIRSLFKRLNYSKGTK